MFVKIIKMIPFWMSITRGRKLSKPLLGASSIVQNLYTTIADAEGGPKKKIHVKFAIEEGSLVWRDRENTDPYVVSLIIYVDVKQNLYYNA